MKTMKKIRVLVVDDHFVVRMGLAGSINAEPDMRVIAEGRTGRQAVELFRRHMPDVTLMDIRLPGLDGIEATGSICREFPGARILILSHCEGDQDIRRAVAAGARGYLLKSVEREELLDTIRAVHAGEHRLAPEAAARLAEGLKHPDLNERELKILQLIVQGKSNKEIGAVLGLSEVTIKRDGSSLFAKLQANDRTQAATLAIQRGIVHLQ
jgi:DNA-binding NarL/FixJ family response regulator